MRHLKAGKKLNRTSSHRKAMFANMSVALVEHELIKTTLAKAKELRRVIEPIITRAAVDSVHNRRLVFADLRDKAAVAKLFNVLGPRYEARPGGYLRIIKCGFRPGDSAPMAYVELVDRGMSPEETAQKKPTAIEKNAHEEGTTTEAIQVADGIKQEAPADTAVEEQPADRAGEEQPADRAGEEQPADRAGEENVAAEEQPVEVSQADEQQEK